ncbi:Crp/Fnr family transcriptional regulator [Spongiivirga citrea]|uniref:Helix-turn-helix domain-containing protein n=1 Tax=Spongiivirga citrea TaxID=1481457 RepID=A0A6M0CPT8_9FLAO|nr:Crp/Fnr family transcriptional regulator [Spongiivirga citrea]NER15940.1 helix-turn-helix domain-containing protein [Spongiivirga citrea]
MKQIANKIAFLGKALADEILHAAIVKQIPKATEILRKDQYINVIPFVVEGLVKVISRFEERELLLYYIQPKESCIMSFSAGLYNQPSKIYAVTEEDSTLLLLPVEKVREWIKTYPKLNELFYQQYNERYVDLLTSIEQILISKMDKRLYDYLKEKAKVTANNELKITHNQIANELGTVREVISRVLKKLEVENKIKQSSQTIKVLSA